MKTQLTLTIDQNILEEAKKLARARGLSLSDIIEDYLNTLTSDVIKSDSAETPILKSLKGSFNAPIRFDYKNELSKALNERYRQ